jgi:hypothetical protein
MNMNIYTESLCSMKLEISFFYLKHTLKMYIKCIKVLSIHFNVLVLSVYLKCIFNVKGEISNLLVHTGSVYILEFLYNGPVMAHIQDQYWSQSNI